jgi:signal transduction histidine kinase
MDSGKGIPKNELHKIFDPFYTTKVVGEGTGLGLAICKEIVEKHDATIQVLEDSPNTCFELSFKITKAANVA